MFNFSVCFGHVSLSCVSRHGAQALSPRPASQVGQVPRYTARSNDDVLLLFILLVKNSSILVIKRNEHPFVLISYHCTIAYSFVKAEMIINRVSQMELNE